MDSSIVSRTRCVLRKSSCNCDCRLMIIRSKREVLSYQELARCIWVDKEASLYFACEWKYYFLLLLSWFSVLFTGGGSKWMMRVFWGWIKGGRFQDRCLVPRKPGLHICSGEMLHPRGLKTIYSQYPRFIFLCHPSFPHLHSHHVKYLVFTRIKARTM